jgi:phosphate/sulfate permease
MKNRYKQFIDSIVVVSFLYGVIYLFSNTNILAFINNKFFNFIVVWIISVIIAVFISFAIDYLFNKWRKK